MCLTFKSEVEILIGFEFDQLDACQSDTMFGMRGMEWNGNTFFLFHFRIFILERKIFQREMRNILHSFDFYILYSKRVVL